MALAKEVVNQIGAIREFEKPKVSEAIKVANANKLMVCLSPMEWAEREARLKKEYEKDTKAPGSAENRIKEDSGVNPALAEAATQFNDALLDEQAKKIAELTKENERLERVSKTTTDEFNKLYYRMITKSDKIAALGKEISKLNGIIHDKNEELKRKTKGCCELITENVDLKKKLAGKVVDKIDAQALKSAESALAYKEKVIADLGKELKRQKALAGHISKKYDGAKINLKVRTEGLERLEKELEEKTKLIETIRKGSKEYCDYGIAAEKMIQKMAKVIVEDRAICAEDFEEYRRLANGYRFNPQLPELSEEETAKILDFNAKCMRAARESINDVFESYAAKYAKSSLDDLKEKAYESFNAKACKLGLVGSKDGNGILDQMVGIDIAEEGGDHSGVILLCGKGITISKDEAKIIERCTKNGTELHYSEKDGLTYTNMYGEEMPIKCLRGLFHVFTDEELKKMKK